VDWWIRLLLGFAVAGVSVAMGSVVLEGADPVVTTVTILCCLAGLALFVSLLIRCGPFRWTVPIDSITAVEETRNPLSSPALSLDRLRIRYGKQRQVMVSPADKAGFMKAIGKDLQGGP
jgi:hypothetical protein